MTSTPDRHPGPLEEDEELRLGDNPSGPSQPGAMAFTGTDLMFRDAAGTFNARSGSGLTESTHENLDTLVHELSETSFAEVTRDVDGIVTDVVTWTSAAKVTKVREYNLTRTSGRVTTVVSKQYNAAGTLIQTLTEVITRSSGKYATSTITET